MSLIFEKVEPDVEIGSTDLAGMSIGEVTAYIKSVVENAPPHPSTINLGCGPEPENLVPRKVILAALTLLAVPLGEELGNQRVGFAKRTGAWFYWCYAIALVEKELEEKLGSRQAAREVIYADGEDRTEFWTLRSEKFRWGINERFGLNLR